jgi:hypothetical protein
LKLLVKAASHPPRSRILYGLTSLCVIGLGLASRAWYGLFPPALGKYPGDALWALMVFLGLGFLLPKVSTRSLGMVALCVAFLDEFSQLYQADWINAVRSTALGHLVLGAGFSWADLLAYTIGVAAGILFDLLVRFFQNMR